MKTEYYTLIISMFALLCTILSWFVIHGLNQKRDFANKKKELRIKYLISAWQLLESVSNRTDETLQHNLEKAIADIQLFGTLKQIRLSREFALKFSQNKIADSTELLNELRNDLRKELNLDKVSSSDFISLRVKK